MVIEKLCRGVGAPTEVGALEFRWIWCSKIFCNQFGIKPVQHFGVVFLPKEGFPLGKCMCLSFV